MAGPMAVACRRLVGGTQRLHEPDDARQGLFRVSPSLQPARTLLHQTVAAQRDRTSAVSEEPARAVIQKDSRPRQGIQLAAGAQRTDLPGDAPVLAEDRGRWGGYGLYLLKGKPVFNYNMLILGHYRGGDQEPPSAGKHTIVFDYTYDGPGIARQASSCGRRGASRNLREGRTSSSCCVAIHRCALTSSTGSRVRSPTRCPSCTQSAGATSHSRGSDDVALPAGVAPTGFDPVFAPPLGFSR